MIITEKEILLKNGKAATLRNPVVEDAEGLIEYLRKAAGETEFIVRYPEEVTMTFESEQKWITNGVESENNLLVSCLVDGKIVGNCEINFFTALKTRHRAVVAIAVNKEYWNLGIGSAMFEVMIDAAKKRGTEIVELEFVEGNDRARHLYEKMGFRVISVRPDVFRFKDGSYHGEVYMQKRM